jgi:N-acyl homoserine lactone hydrolase
MSIAGQLAKFVTGTSADDLPPLALERARMASLDRFKKIAEALKATVIIQHDSRDIGKLPALPSAAK